MFEYPAYTKGDFNKNFILKNIFLTPFKFTLFKYPSTFSFCEVFFF